MGHCDLWPGSRLLVKEILGCCLAEDKLFKPGDVKVLFTDVSEDQGKGGPLVLVEDQTVTGVCCLMSPL